MLLIDWISGPLDFLNNRFMNIQILRFDGFFVCKFLQLYVLIYSFRSFLSFDLNLHVFFQALYRGSLILFVLYKDTCIFFFNFQVKSQIQNKIQVPNRLLWMRWDQISYTKVTYRIRRTWALQAFNRFSFSKNVNTSELGNGMK